MSTSTATHENNRVDLLRLRTLAARPALFDNEIVELTHLARGLGLAVTVERFSLAENTRTTYQIGATRG